MGASSRTPAQLDDTFQTAFLAAWVAAGQDAAIVAWENLGFDPANLEAYVIADLKHAVGDIASLGTGTQIQMRRDVIFAAQIFVRHNKGRGLSNQLAEICLDFLESTHLTGIRIISPGLAEAGRVNQWYQVNANAIVQYDSYRTV